jgi:hypothetical protein
MTVDPVADSPLERLLARILLVVFWVAFSSLGVGLAAWLADPAGPHAARILTAGLFGLLSMPLLRTAAILVTAARRRDAITFTATLAVLAILIALTLRDAGSR